MNAPDHDAPQVEWVTISTFSSGLEADIARQQLEAEGIPVLVNSNAPGIFGASFQGHITGGVSLRVPSTFAEDAQALLAIDEDDGDWDEEVQP